MKKRVLTRTILKWFHGQSRIFGACVNSILRQNRTVIKNGSQVMLVYDVLIVIYSLMRNFDWVHRKLSDGSDAPSQKSCGIPAFDDCCYPPCPWQLHEEYAAGWQWLYIRHGARKSSRSLEQLTRYLRRKPWAASAFSWHGTMTRMRHFVTAAHWDQPARPEWPLNKN